MLTKRSAIGIGIGSVAVILGSFFLLQSIISNSHDVNDSVDIGKSDIFSFDAEKHYHEFLNVTGSSFHVKMKTPNDGLAVDDDFKNKVSFDWVSLGNGKHFINITNTGGSVLHVTGKLQAVTNPLIFTSHLIVISSGVLIIGISAVFSIRRPKGF
ncbi:MAG: hypothetical protein KGI28_04760 [Thaumarchaeota archaeon]|nr:hypothetical protein [Nitrososphaerota archaeon]